MDTNASPVLAKDLDFRPPRPLLRWIAVLLALAGWWLSWDLARLSFGSKANTPWMQDECGGPADPAAPANIFDCRSVLNSRWASVPPIKDPSPGRIPTAVYGMAYFAFVGFWFLFVGPTTRSRWARHLLIVAIVAIGVLFSALMIQVMHGELHKWCRWCLVTHAVNGLLCVATIASFPWRPDAPNRAPHPRGRLALATLGGCVCLFLLHLSLAIVVIANKNSQRMLDEYTAVVNDPAYVRWDYERQPIEPLVADLPADDGAADAPNHVVIFVDAECPACKTAYETLQSLKDKYPGKLRITYRNYPQDPACNPAYAQGGHAASCRAARAIEAARVVGDQEDFLAMRALCYERSDELEIADFALWADELGLDPAKFAAAMDSAEIEQRVKDDIAFGDQLGVKAIPVLYLNGRQLRHWRKADTWEALLIGIEPTSQPAPPIESPAAQASAG